MNSDERKRLPYAIRPIPHVQDHSGRGSRDAYICLADRVEMVVSQHSNHRLCREGLRRTIDAMAHLASSVVESLPIRLAFDRAARRRLARGWEPAEIYVVPWFDAASGCS